ncbi:MAG: hypothetical protein AB1705_05950 [Verrucomicrobiota bacterium]
MEADVLELAEGVHVLGAQGVQFQRQAHGAGEGVFVGWQELMGVAGQRQGFQFGAAARGIRIPGIEAAQGRGGGADGVVLPQELENLGAAVGFEPFEELALKVVREAFEGGIDTGFAVRRHGGRGLRS